MKILYVAHNHPPKDAPLESIGGMQRVSVQLLKELQKMKGIEVETVVLETSWKYIGFKTIIFLVKQLFELPQKARDSEADAILFSSMVTACLAFFTRGKVDIPMVTINHGKDVTLPIRLYQWFVPKVFANLDGVISVSHATLKASKERGLDPEKGIALGNGFNMERLEVFPGKRESREKLQQKFGIDLDHNFMLLTVGRQVKRKGHEWFIRNVFSKLRQDVIFVVIGDGPEFVNIERAVAETNNQDRIFLLGRQPEDILKASYSAADLFIMPNIPVEGDMEGFGIVLLEANMAQTPAIAANLEGIKDVITDGKNGYKIRPLDDVAFAKKINIMLCKNLEEFSKQTRLFVQHQFSWEHVAQEYIRFIQKIVNEYSSASVLI